jgi:hypothetical protein
MEQDDTFTWLWTGLIRASGGGRFAFPVDEISGDIRITGRAYAFGKGRVVGAAVS